MYNDTVKDSTMGLEDNTWEVFKHVRDFALKMIQWKQLLFFRNLHTRTPQDQRPESER